MGSVTVSRPAQPLVFEPRLPGDKSITHRAFLLSTLAQGSYTVEGWNPGEDCRHTLQAVEALGVRVERSAGRLVFRGAEGRLRRPVSLLDLGNAGTGLRLLLGVLAGQPFETTLTGDASLRRRPMRRVLEPLEAMGAETSGDVPPVSIRGGNLRSLRYTLPVASAQVKSALLLAGVQASGTTILEGPVGTRDHTERLLRFFGVPVESTPDRVQVTGPATPAARDLRIPGDPSAAAFFASLPGLLPGCRVTCSGVALNPGRTGFVACLERMGLTVESRVEEPEPEPVGSLRAEGALSAPLVVGPEEVPGIVDELPILAVLCALAPGTSTLSGLSELKVKESNRLETVYRGLKAIGARARLREDGWTIEGTGGGPLKGGAVHAEGDHRVAMAFLMAGLACDRGVRVTGDAGIETSDPFFRDNLRRLQEARV